MFRLFDANIGRYIDPRDYPNIPLGLDRNGNLLTPSGIIVEQFSGFVDVQNIPLYEGDVCDYDVVSEVGIMRKRGIMEFNKESGGFMFNTTDSTLMTPDMDLVTQNVQWVGPILTNPKLLDYGQQAT